MKRTPEQQEIVDTASLILLSVQESERGALVERMVDTYLDGMRREWPGLAESDLLSNAAKMVVDVFRRLGEIEAAGGRISGRA